MVPSWAQIGKPPNLARLSLSTLCCRAPADSDSGVANGLGDRFKRDRYWAFTFWKNTSSSGWVCPEMGSSALTGSVIRLRDVAPCGVNRPVSGDDALVFAERVADRDLAIVVGGAKDREHS